MRDHVDRRTLLRLAGATLGAGALYRFAPLLASSPEGRALARSLGKANGEAPAPFSFVQLSDTHVGLGAPQNPLGTAAFERAIDRIGALSPAPELVIVTGDLTHES